MGYTKHRKVFTDKMEKDLAGHCVDMVQWYHGLTLDKMKSLAYEFAELNNVDMPQSWVDNKLGKIG